MTRDVMFSPAVELAALVRKARLHNRLLQAETDPVYHSGVRVLRITLLLLMHVQNILDVHCLDVAYLRAPLERSDA